MSLDLYSGRGYEGPVASNKGWSDVIAALGFRSGSGASKMSANMRAFVRDGTTDSPAAVAKELRAWLDEDSERGKQNGVRETVANLTQLLSESRDFATVTDGV